MKRLFTFAALGLAVAAPALTVRAGPGDAQSKMRTSVREGEVLTTREIEARILPTMPGMQYLGPEYDPAAMAYRLKFIQNGRVVFVDVDARTGDIIRQSR